MYKLLFDSDALIKASKAEFLDAVVESFDVLITEEVYEETVEEGKKGIYQDADKIEEHVQSGEIKLLKREYYNKKKKPKKSFGRGEASVFQAHKKDILIVADDLSFVSYIKKQGIKFVPSAYLIFALVKKKRLSKDKANYCLEKLRPLIRKEVYELVKKDLGG